MTKEGKSATSFPLVTPTKVGVQLSTLQLDSGVRRNDDGGKCARGMVRGYPSSGSMLKSHLATFSHKGEKENGHVMRGLGPAHLPLARDGRIRLQCDSGAGVHDRCRPKRHRQQALQEQPCFAVIAGQQSDALLL